MHQPRHITRRLWWRRVWLIFGTLMLVVLLPTLSTVGVISARITKAAAAGPLAFAVAPFTTNSAVALENQHLGTTDWMLDPKADKTIIEGYAGVASAQPNDVVPLYISTAIPLEYSLDVYRMGWYGGTGARLMLSAFHLQGMPQGLWAGHTGLAGCRTCTFDPKTRLVDAHWRATYQLVIPLDWLSGVYLIKLSVGQTAQSYIPLIVRDDGSQAGVLVNLPVMTYQAYNIWGGYSLYGHAGKLSADGDSTNGAAVGRAFKVSFNRPYERSAGAGDFLTWDIHTIRWLERSGIDASYTTDVDVARAPWLLENHRVYLDAGHDEYWTLAMRNGVEIARDAGVNLAFLGANDAYWQARLEADSDANPQRTLVCYKVISGSKDPHYNLKIDPMYPAHPELVTSQWRDPVVGRPENSLLGLMYSSYFSSNPKSAPDLVIQGDGTSNSLLTKIGLQGGEHIHAGVLGYEYDTIFKNGLTPGNLVVLADSPVINIYRTRESAYSAYYRAPSGALVFDAGSIWWSYGLDSFTVPGAAEVHPFPPNQAISDITATLLHEMLRDPSDTSTPSFELPTIGG